MRNKILPFIKKNLVIILSIISVLSIICWMISDFFGGMIIVLITYGVILLPLIILYVVTFFIALFKIALNGIKSNKLLYYTHLTGVMAIILFCIYNSELLKSRVIMEVFVASGDLNSTNIIFRESGRFETTVNGMFGYTEKITGKYQWVNDTITFLDKPYGGDIIPQKIIVDRKDSTVYAVKDKVGDDDQRKILLNDFRITKIDF